MYEQRIQAVRERMKDDGVDVMFIVDRSNTAWLCGFGGTASYILVGHDDAFFFTDDRYLERARRELPDMFTIIRVKRKPWDVMSSRFKALSPSMIGFEESLSYQKYMYLVTAADENTEIKEAEDIIRGLRMIKDPHEIDMISRAVKKTDDVFAKVVEYITPGRRESDIVRQIKHIALDNEIDELAFHPIVASGHNSAIPHHEPGEHEIAEGDLVIIDMGMKWHGYCSDMTRTVFVGSAPSRVKEMYRILREAQSIGIQHARAGISAREIDGYVRNYLKIHGYDKAFLHSLGHSLGLDIHEPPRLNAENETVLQTGMVVTIEPGIYLNDFGGIRIEDTIVITEKGNTVLTNTTKDLIEL